MFTPKLIAPVESVELEWFKSPAGLTFCKPSVAFSSWMGLSSYHRKNKAATTNPISITDTRMAKIVY